MAATTDGTLPDFLIKHTGGLITNLIETIEPMRHNVKFLRFCRRMLTKEFMSLTVPACDVGFRLAEYDYIVGQIQTYERKIAILEKSLPELIAELEVLKNGTIAMEEDE